MNSRPHIYTFLLLCIPSVLFAIFLVPTSFGQSPEELPTETTTPPTREFMMATPVFSTTEQSVIVVTPTFTDSTTNLAFYLKCPNTLCPDQDTGTAPTYQFSAENIGRGDLPFSEYWAPPLTADYAVIEYANDDQQFSCSGISFEACLADSHFVQVFYFALVDEGTPITPELRAEKDRQNNPSPLSDQSDTLAVSEALRLLSINLSSTSISSDLDNGLIVTASLDGIPSVVLATSSTSSVAVATTSHEESSSPIKDFFADVLETVVGLFVEPETPPTPPTPPVEVPEPPTTEETPVPIPPTDIPNEVDTTVDAVQSFISNDVTTPDDVTTASF